jgi:hypothetical protein
MHPWINFGDSSDEEPDDSHSDISVEVANKKEASIHSWFARANTL